MVRGHLPEPELRAALAGATALVYPSLREGFGLPVLEAKTDTDTEGAREEGDPGEVHARGRKREDDPQPETDVVD